MSDQFIQVPPQSTGLKVDCTELTVGANVVERERVNIADPTSATAIAGVTAGGALKVDGSAVTQPVSLTGNQAVNVAQINAVTPLMGNGVTGTGSPRVTIASDNTAFTVNAAQSGTWTVQPGNTANTTPWLMKRSDGTSIEVVDPCSNASLTRNSVNINQTGGAQLIAGVTAKQTYICSIFYVTATAQNIALVEGTGTVCATGIAGMAGGSTAATGQNWAANSGWTNPATGFWHAKTATTANNVCLLQSGTGQISGVVTYVQV